MLLEILSLGGHGPRPPGFAPVGNKDVTTAAIEWNQITRNQIIHSICYGDEEGGGGIVSQLSNFASSANAELTTGAQSKELRGCRWEFQKFMIQCTVEQ